MAKSIVFSLTGRDKIGIVDQATKVVIKHGGNVEASRMARLGGEFAVLMLVSLPDNQDVSNLDDDLSIMREEGYRVSLIQTEDDHTRKYAGWLPYEIEVLGADHDGIIHKIANHLASQGINIESMDTGTSPAPMSGTPLFAMNAVVIVPPNLPFYEWSDGLDEIGHNLNVNVKVTMVK